LCLLFTLIIQFKFSSAIGKLSHDLVSELSVPLVIRIEFGVYLLVFIFKAVFQVSTPLLLIEHFLLELGSVCIVLV